ncbi:hypothetical protein EV363DRAFT_1291781 [Boletus edulis]|nr:hypothetical protein EV363DRAFT_1291781 [Boletus edulis]
MAIEHFAFQCIRDVIDAELDEIRHVLQCPAEDLSMDELCNLFVEDLILKLSSPGFGGTPKLCLSLFTRDTSQKYQSTPLFWHHDEPPMNDMRVVQDWVHQFPFVITHDNVNIPFRVYAQRVDNQSHFDCGTASTVFFQPYAPPEIPLCNCTLQEYRVQGRLTPLSIQQLYVLAHKAMPSQYDQDVYRVLSYLIHSPEFNLTTYDHKDHEIFTPPNPIHQLSTGEKFVTWQFMLGTEHLKEASYEGNANVIAAVLHQLHLDTEAEMKKTGLD